MPNFIGVAYSVYVQVTYFLTTTETEIRLLFTITVAKKWSQWVASCINSYIDLRAPVHF